MFVVTRSVNKLVTFCSKYSRQAPRSHWSVSHWGTRTRNPTHSRQMPLVMDTFHSFSNLAPELRLKVWETAANDAINGEAGVCIYSYNKETRTHDPLVVHRRPSVLAQVNAESRAVASTVSNQRPFEPKDDILFVPVGFWYEFIGSLAQSSASPGWAAEVQQIAIETAVGDYAMYCITPSWIGLPKLQTIYLVFPVTGGVADVVTRVKLSKEQLVHPILREFTQDQLSALTITADFKEFDPWSGLYPEKWERSATEHMVEMRHKIRNTVKHADRLPHYYNREEDVLNVSIQAAYFV
ncbi:hypothetical protein B0I35DRAFT_424106 [Stachybotrys elegans]|uniref:2EXR domain-containing protein n=1 Tax=Stachybotrys elegans TaxID=80388 RepID=A0A8K0WU66_9HYPO|nr:hypothetical protein B0I35DRAFT_424106 [Stachybotrys elegans]